LEKIFLDKSRHVQYSKGLFFTVFTRGMLFRKIPYIQECHETLMMTPERGIRGGVTGR
jgi:hypothetical protein